MTNKTKFKLGEVVLVRTDLVVGKVYKDQTGEFGDKFSTRMSNNLGKEAKVVALYRGGYVLEFDTGKGEHLYYDEMLLPYSDSLAKKEYEFNAEVEGLLEKILQLAPEQIINNALDSKLFETDLDKFKEIVEKYNHKK